jgi:transposase
MIQAFSGIDIAKDKFDVALLMGDKFKTKAFTNTLKGFEAFLLWTQKYASNIHFCMESSGIYGKALATFLHERGLKVSVVNPFKIKAFGQCELSRNKTDEADAKLIARYCKVMEPAIWEPEPEHIQELQAWVKRLDDLKKARVQEENRLESASKTTKEDINAHINYLDQSIINIEKMIKEHINAHADLKEKKELVSTIPGIGNTTASMILAFLGTPEKFENAKQMAAFVGLNPRRYQSGSSVLGKTRLSKVGDASIRKALFLPAMVARQCNPIIKKFCDNLSAAGKSKMLILGAAMRKLVHIIYGVLKNGKPFNPSYSHF